MAKRKSTRAPVDRSPLGRALDQARKKDGLTQHELAKRLKSSQATICKIINKNQPPRPSLEKRIRTYLDAGRGLGPAISSDWINRIIRAASKSPAFATLVEAAIEIVENE